MDDVPSSAQRALTTLLPAALLRDISCYVFSDEHPFDNRPFDVTICTSRGEVVELQGRRALASIVIGESTVPRNISIYRNLKNMRFYLVLTFEELYVISCEEHLVIFKRFDNVDSFAVNDPYCKGSARLRVWSNEDAVPVTLDDNFEQSANFDGTPIDAEDCSTFVSSLKSKLTAARHTVALNEKRYNKLLKFRQAAQHTLLQDMCPNSPNSAFKSCQKVHTAMRTPNPVPWLKLCNGKVVVGVTICNDTNSTCFHKIKLILQSNTNYPIDYRTEIYTSITTAPFWLRKSSNDLEPESQATIVAITDIEDYSHCNKILYKGVIVYEMEGCQKFIPLQAKTLHCLETLNESFDLLSSKFENSDFIAILATTTALRLKVLHTPAASDAILPDLVTVLESHMKMERAGDTENVLVHRTSPYHALNGLVILVHDSEMVQTEVFNTVSVYYRNKSQLSSLLHLIHDGVPYRLLITLPGVNIKGKNSSNRILTKREDIADESMDIDDILMSTDDKLMDFGNSLSAQMTIVLAYLDECIVSMAANNNIEDLNLIGTQVNLLGAGVLKYLDFTRILCEEIRKGNAFLIVM